MSATSKIHQRRLAPVKSFHFPTPLDPQAYQSFREKAGPRTPEGKAISARNATTHGLFCRQTVLPHLGEDPDAYKHLLDALYQQIDPRTLMERQYVELWADASWKLRRLSRLESQIWEKEDLEEDVRLQKLERVLRLQTVVRRQMDKAVKMLNQDLPQLQERYSRRAVLAGKHLTEADCKSDRQLASEIEAEVQADILDGASTADLDQTTLDNADIIKNDQNELPIDLSNTEFPPATSLSPILMGERCPMRVDRGPS